MSVCVCAVRTEMQTKHELKTPNKHIYLNAKDKTNHQFINKQIKRVESKEIFFSFFFFCSNTQQIYNVCIKLFEACKLNR